MFNESSSGDKIKKYLILDFRENRGNFEYYFETEDYLYQILIYKYQGSDGYYSIGFKAKRPGEHFYTTDLITNQNVFNH